MDAVHDWGAERFPGTVWKFKISCEIGGGTCSEFHSRQFSQHLGMAVLYIELQGEYSHFTFLDNLQQLLRM